MLYFYGLLFALQLTIGQIFWKLAVEKNSFELASEFLLSKRILSFLTSPYLILGVVLYLSATVLNMWMLTKYPLNTVQLVAIPLTLILVVLAGWRIFGESLSVVNLVGIAILIVGVSLATMR